MSALETKKKRGRPPKAKVAAVQPAAMATCVYLNPSTVSELASNINASTLLRSMDYFEHTRMEPLGSCEGALTIYSILDILYNNYSKFMSAENVSERRAHVSVGIAAFNRTTIFNACRAGNTFVLTHLGKLFFLYPAETQEVILSELPLFDPFCSIPAPSQDSESLFSSNWRVKDFMRAAMARPVQFFASYYGIKVAHMHTDSTELCAIHAAVVAAYPRVHEIASKFKSTEELRF